MEYITINYKKFFIPIENYNFSCFNLISENIDINYFYLYLNSEIEYKLKNIWNNIIFSIKKFNNIICKKC